MSDHGSYEGKNQPPAFGVLIEIGYDGLILLPYRALHFLDDVRLLEPRSSADKIIRYSTKFPKFELYRLRDILPSLPDPGIAARAKESRMAKLREELKSLEVEE